MGKWVSVFTILWTVFCCFASASEDFDSNLSVAFRPRPRDSESRYFHYETNHEEPGKFSIAFEVIIDRETMQAVDLYMAYTPTDHDDRPMWADGESLELGWIGEYGNKFKRVGVIGIQVHDSAFEAIMLAPEEKQLILQFKTAPKLFNIARDLLRGYSKARIPVKETPVQLLSTGESPRVLPECDDHLQLNIRVPKDIDLKEVSELLNAYFERKNSSK